MRETLNQPQETSPIDNFELEDAEIGLTAEEKKAVDALSEKDIELVKKFRLENITQQKKEVTAVRSEDLVFLLEGIHKGYLPMRGGRIRSKAEGSYFYVTPNPESSFAETHPNILKNSNAKNFYETSVGNLKLYGHTAIAAAIERNIYSKLNDTSGLEEILSARYKNQGATEIDFEDFFDDLVDEVQKSEFEKNLFKLPRRYPAFAILKKYLEKNKIDHEQFMPFLKTLPKRGGIILAFNEKLLKDKDIIVDDLDVIHAANEVAFKVPTGKIDLDNLAGFESLGNFEDDILERIGASPK